MSQSHSSHTKKRKQAAKDDAATSSKKIRLDGPDASKKGKGKSRDVSSNEFRVVKATLTLSVAPVFANKPRSGVEEMLDSMIMRYIPALQGVVLSHSNLVFADTTASIKGDCPFLICKVSFDATVWSPQVGMTLAGKVNIASPDHVSLLVHRTFNVSIPRHHILTDNWEFQYGPAENDPEFGNDTPSGEDEEDEEAAPHKSDEAHGGKWVHKLTGQPLGGAEGVLSFTVIGLTVANEMLSLIGSLQEDPFSPRHVATPGVASHPSHENTGADDAEEEHAPILVEEEEEEDTFQQLGRKADEAAAKEAERQAAEEAEQKATKSRKRKSKKKEGDEADAPAPTKKQKKQKA
ncbi:hypothetical protein HGRIS_002186 [Hohenbuehelia grisea]|uniref:RPA43 OB domain-containing protein n=1 Tax=Hohenbuehelia grisea TaxID=104357 RepID=A0ABR3JJV2_9AGAR